MTPARQTEAERGVLRATLVDAARRVVDRDGPGGLTMRSLATEAGCAVGLPYKVFASRDELVAELIAAELGELQVQFRALVAGAGTGTVGGNLGRYADLLLGSPVVGLAHEIAHDEVLSAAVDKQAGDTGAVSAVVTTVTEYLAAEQRLGRVDDAVDVEAFGFLVAGAVHNLLMAGDPYPRPSAHHLRQMLAAVADRLTTPLPQPARPPREDPDGNHQGA